MAQTDHDVAIVGASAAGCAAATLLARLGLSVALVERSPDPAAYKTVCTHYIQASATPAIRRLGLAEPIEAAGGVRNSIDLWTRYGWIRDSDDGDLPFGYSIRREKLDPLVRELAAATPGVELLSGRRATELIERDGRIAGVRVAGRDGGEQELRARLVVAADGRSSKLAEMAGARTRSFPNRRFTYWAYFRDLPLAKPDRAQLWLLDPHVAYAFPNDDGVTLVAYWGLQSELDTFREDVDASVRAHFSELPGAPRLETGTPITKWLGKVDMPNVYRGCVQRGMALVGDAAQASDPMWGVGLGWAFQSAEWLADAVGPALTGGGDLDAGLSAYRRRHRRGLAAHHLLISDYSRGRRFRAIEKLIFSAGARDPEVAKHMHRFAGRTIGVHQFLSPAMLARASLTLARRAPRLEQEPPSGDGGSGASGPNGRGEHATERIGA
jgi:flavin-dependent dehydrogenase